MKYRLIDWDEEESIQTTGYARKAVIDKDEATVRLYSTNEETRLIDLRSMSVILEDDLRDPVIPDDLYKDRFTKLLKAIEIRLDKNHTDMIDLVKVQSQSLIPCVISSLDILITDLSARVHEDQCIRDLFYAKNTKE
jgi:hypothetical protein